jgi:hypothetical protein
MHRREAGESLEGTGVGESGASGAVCALWEDSLLTSLLVDELVDAARIRKAMVTSGLTTARGGVFLL